LTIDAGRFPQGTSQQRWPGLEEQSYRGGWVELTVASTPPDFVRLVVSASSSLAAAIAASARCRS